MEGEFGVGLKEGSIRSTLVPRTISPFGEEAMVVSKLLIRLWLSMIPVEAVKRNGCERRRGGCGKRVMKDGREYSAQAMSGDRSGSISRASSPVR